MDIFSHRSSANPGRRHVVAWMATMAVARSGQTHGANLRLWALRPFLATKFTPMHGLCTLADLAGMTLRVQISPQGTDYVS